MRKSTVCGMVVLIALTSLTGTAKAQDTLSPSTPGYADIFADWRDQDGIKSSGILPPGPANIAVGKTATQSSTANGGTPDRAVDGNTDGNFNNNSVTHTNADAQAWWQVDLGASAMIDSVAVFNRTDCCNDRLTDFAVKLSSNGTTWTDSAVLAGQCGTPSVFKFSKTARYVRVQLHGTNNLTIAEVQVFSGYSSGGSFVDPGYRPVISAILSTLSVSDRTTLQARLDALPPNSPDLVPLYIRACSARRAMRMSGYVAKFKNILFSEHPVLGGGYFFDNVWSSGGVAGRGLEQLTMQGYYGAVAHLLPSGEARHPDVSFDGTRALFSWRGGNSGSDVYHLYEMNLSTRVTRQLTIGSGEFAIDLDPCYLPNGDIVFVSSRYAQEIDCVRGRVINLMLCGKDGKYMRQIGFDQVPIMYPRLLPSGQVIYARWDYNDKAHSYAHALFTMNPDGTNQREYCNNNSWWPTMILQERPIPGSTKIMAMIGGYHTPEWGKIGIIDVNVGTQNGQGVTLVAPVRQPKDDNLDSWGNPGGGPYAWRAVDAAVYPKAGAAALDQWGQNPPLFADPFPFDENAFLVSYLPASQVTAWNNRMGLYFMTVDAKRELLYRDSSGSCMGAVTMGARPVPPILSNAVNYRDSIATFQISKINLGQSLPGVADGIITRLRVVELYFRPGPENDVYEHCGPGDINYGGSNYLEAIATENASWDAKWIVGETPVQSDGSASFKVPARRPLFFQALNAKGQVVQTMRSWTTLQPGEVLSCTGCHESKLNPPPPLTYVPIALKQAPLELEPFYGPRRGFTFNAEIQPILTAKCVSCHSAATPNGIDLSGTLVAQPAGNPVNRSYLNLVSHDHCNAFSKYVSWFAAEDSPILQPPYRAGSCRSYLDSLLDKGHHNVVLTDQELRTIRCWIDIGVPIWGTYQEGHPGSEANLTARNAWIAQEKKNIADYLLTVGTIGDNDRHQSSALVQERWTLSAGYAASKSLTVKFTVPRYADRQLVRVTLYTMRGTLVTTLVNGRTSAGHHSCRFPVPALGAGQYLVRMSAGGFEKAVPIVIVE